MSNILNKITLREVGKLCEAEILLRDIPHDNTAGHLPIILEKIRNGSARTYCIENHGKNIGVCVYEIHGYEFVILAMIVSKVINVFESVYPIITQYAREKGCLSLVFWTVRPGLVITAIKNGWNISHVEMRKTL